MMDGFSVSLADITATAAAGLIVWAIKESRLNRKELGKGIEEVGTQVNKVDGRLGVLDEKLIGHMRLDDERMEGMKSRQEQILSKMDNRRTTP